MNFSWKGEYYCFNGTEYDIYNFNFSTNLFEKDYSIKVPFQFKKVKHLFNKKVGEYELYCLTNSLEFYVYKNKEWRKITKINSNENELFDYHIYLLNGPKILFFDYYNIFILDYNDFDAGFTLYKVEYKKKEEENDEDSDIEMGGLDEKTYRILSVEEKEMIIVDNENEFKIINLKNFSIRNGIKSLPKCYAFECVVIKKKYNNFFLSTRNKEIFKIHDGGIKNMVSIVDYSEHESELVVEYLDNENCVEIFSCSDFSKIAKYINVREVIIDDFLSYGYNQILIIFKSTNKSDLDYEVIVNSTSKFVCERFVRKSQEKNLYSIQRALQTKLEESDEKLNRGIQNLKKKQLLLMKQSKLLERILKKKKGNKIEKNEDSMMDDKKKFKIVLKNFIPIRNIEEEMEEEGEDEENFYGKYNIIENKQSFNSNEWNLDFKIDFGCGKDRFYFLPFIFEEKVFSIISREKAKENIYNVNIKLRSPRNFSHELVLYLVLSQEREHYNPFFKFLGNIRPSQKQKLLGVSRSYHYDLPDLNRFCFFVYNTEKIEKFVFEDLNSIFLEVFKLSVKREIRDVENQSIEYESSTKNYFFVKIESVHSPNSVVLSISTLDKNDIVIFLKILLRNIHKKIRVVPFLIREKTLELMFECLSNLMKELNLLLEKKKLGQKKMVNTDLSYCSLITKYPL